MKFSWKVNSNEKIVGEKRYNSFSFFGYSDEIKAREKDVEILHAQVELRLFLFMWFTVNHIPVSLYVFHVAELC
jgi:hypothetical protein